MKLTNSESVVEAGLLGQDSIRNFGLLGGKVGESILAYCYSKDFGDPDVALRAEQLLDDVAANIADVDDYGYGDGLAGIGYGIEWLAQNQLIEVDTDEILGEIDDELYKAVVYSRSKIHSLGAGTLGKAMYFYKRLKARNKNTERYKKICLQECLVLLSDELHDYFLDEASGLLSSGAQSNHDLEVMGQTLIFMEKLLAIRVNNEAVTQVICSIQTAIIDRLNEACKNGFIAVDLFVLYAFVVTDSKGQAWTETSLKWYQKYLATVTEEDAADPRFYYMHKKMSGIFGLEFQGSGDLLPSADPYQLRSPTIELARMEMWLLQ